MSQFYVVKAGDTAVTLNSALSNGCNLFFEPEVYHLSQTLNVTDDGPGVGWTSNTADNGQTVNGTNVLATGRFVEHDQKFAVQWNGQNGQTIFSQNEMRYDVLNRAAWMSTPTTNGYAAFKVANMENA